MFDIGWTEMLVVAVVAILVVGPKDLPGMLRTVGKTVKKVRTMAGDFQRQFDDALKEAELDGVKKSIDDVRAMNPLNKIKDDLNPLKDTAEDLKRELNKAVESSESGLETASESSKFDPGDLFDASKLPKIDEPVKVDVKAALAKEKAKTAAGSSSKQASSKPASTKKHAAKSTGVKKAASENKTNAAKPKKAAARKPVVKKTAANAKPTKAESA